MGQNILYPHEQCMVRVVVRNLNDPDAAPEHDQTGDHNQRYFRDWITKTTYWALRNNRSVTQYPA